jgi:hypothetical protein
MLHETNGILRYSLCDVGYRLVVEMDQNLSDYYRSLIPKYLGVNRQRYPAHVSVVRHETPTVLAAWGKYDGEEVRLTYDSEVKNGRVYYWLNVFSVRLEEVRTELGLPVSSEYTRPPDSWIKCFHMTIGNVKSSTVV